MDNKKVTSYILYAVGEIFLVVIGILIAVSINNWNQELKEDAAEIKALQNLKDDLKYNLMELQRVYAIDSGHAIQNRLLLNHLTDPSSSYHDSLEWYFGGISRYDVFSPRRMAYEALKSKGIELIENEGLRSQIIQLYDEKYSLNTIMLDLRKDFHVNCIAINNHRFRTLDMVGRLRPMSYLALKVDTEFINNLSYMAAEGKNFASYQKNMLDQTAIVLEAIEQELK